MALSRLHSEPDALLPVRKFAQQIQEKPLPVAVWARIAFLTQPHELGASMLERLMTSDSHVGLVLTQGFLSAAGRPDESFRQAAERLGPERSRRYLLMLAAKLWMAFAADGLQLPTRAILKKSLAMGIVASHFGNASKTTTSDVAFGIACSHAVAAAVMAGAFRDRYASFWQMASATNWPLHEQEEATFGMHHGQAAAVVAEAFHCKPEVVEALRTHHAPIQSLSGHPAYMQIAESVAGHLGCLGGEPDRGEALPTAWMIRLGLREEALPGIAGEIAADAAALGI